jgi:hypothetical protein
MGPGGAPQYTPNQLLAQQYGQGSRAFYSPFNSPYRPLDTANGEGGYGGYPGRMGPPGMPGGGSPYGGMAPMGPGFNGFSPAQMARVQQIQQQGPQSFGPGQSYGAMGMDPYAAFRQPDPGALYRQYQQAGPGAAQDAIVRQMQGTDNGAAYRAAMHQQGYQLNQAPGGAFSYSGGPQSGTQYGLDAMKNFQSQQNAGGTGQGPPPSAYQPGSFSAGVAALNRGDPNAQSMLGQAAGLPAQSGRDYGLQATQNFASQQNAGPPPPPAQPFGPAFRNAVNQLQVRPPAPPQRLPYQPGATAQMMQLGRRAPGLPATNQAGRTSGGIQPASGMAPPPPRGSDRGDLSGYNLANVDPSRIRY